MVQKVKALANESTTGVPTQVHTVDLISLIHHDTTVCVCAHIHTHAHTH